MSVIIGWDIGGAHLKAARGEDGRIVDVVQLPSPLRLGLDAVAAAFSAAKARMGAADRHAVTMTGELADAFASRPEGVERLSDLAVRALAPTPVWLYAGRAGFISAEAAGRQAEDVASANWFASGSLVASARRDALVVDVGSTTADIVPVVGGRVVARGYTDAQRLAAGELVYTGLVRTPVPMVAGRAPFAGHWISLVKENFATMGDVHRILGALPEAADQMATADGREKTEDASRARLARVVGRDAADADPADWAALARWFADVQIRAIVDGAALVLSANVLPAAAPIVSAGVGAAIARELARRLGRDHLGFDALLDVAPQARAHAAQCAPAAALAVLATATTGCWAGS
jgi:probable H4MPT-linked C1 transfer pathway protein